MEFEAAPLVSEEEKQRREYFMKKALEEGEKALAEEEVPVGCVFVYKGQIIGSGHNETSKTRNATRHAEVVTVDKILLHSDGKYNKDIFPECEVFVTCEPCIMCASALLLLKVKKVYFGCSNERFGGCGSVFGLHIQDALPGLGFPIVRDIFADEAIDLIKRFYTLENRNAPADKMKKKKKKTEDT